MNKAGKYIVGGAVALVAVQAVRKGVAASKAVPKFLFPRNFKVKNWFLSFDMPFRIVNTDTTAYTVQSLGGRINYDAGKAGVFEFGSYSIAEPITVKPNNSDVFTAQFNTYLPDTISTLRAMLPVIAKPLNFRILGNVSFLAIPISYDQPLQFSIPTKVVAAIKTVLNLFKNKK